MTRAPDESRASPGLAIVSGGSSGIGLECVRILARSGHQIAIIARDPIRLEDARQEALRCGAPQVYAFAANVIDAEACERIVAELTAQAQVIDWLIACAGDVEVGLFEDTHLDVHRRLMEVNYFGALNLTAPIARRMIAQRSGRIVLVSSAAAFVGIAGYSAYGASKFALRGLGEALRVELSPYGITCSVAFPGDTDTPQLTRERDLRPEVTKRIAGTGGIMRPKIVAERMISQASKGRFLLAPSLLLRLFGWTHSLCQPFFLARQERLMRREFEKTRPNSDKDMSEERRIGRTGD